MRNGFTLVELLAVIFLIGILSLIFIPLAYNAIDKAERDSFIANCYKFADASTMYNIKENRGNSVEGTAVSLEELKAKNYLKNIKGYENSVIYNIPQSYTVEIRIFTSNGKYISAGCLLEELETCVEKGPKLDFSSAMLNL